MRIHRVVVGGGLLLASVLVHAAAQVSSVDTAEDEIRSSRSLDPAGQRLVAELNVSYAAVPSRCADGKAAYECSGVMLRGTRQNLPEGQYAWEPYPRGRTLDTSFTFARADIRVPRLAWHYSNGFIITAPQALSVNCFFPIDAESDKRIDQGCGASKSLDYDYSLCETLLSPLVSVDTDNEEYRWTLEQVAQLWIDWDLRFASDMRRRCSYRLNDQYATQRFEVALAVAATVSQAADKPNDMKVQTWNAGYDPRLPIKAFFYINEQGKPFAERDRDQFEQATKIHLPLLKITLAEGQLLKFEVGE